MIRIQDVFTPSTPSLGTHSVWAKRPLDETTFLRALNTPGRQLCVIGETGVGKTSLTMRLLRQAGRSHLVYSCARDTTALDVFEKTLDALRIAKKTGSSTAVSAGAKVIGSVLTFFTAETKTSLEKTWEEQPWSTKASKENVMDALLCTGTTLVIDDMEKIRDQDSKGILADCAKALSDRSELNSHAKLIFIGIAHDAADLLQLDTSIRSRISLQHVPTLGVDAIGDSLIGAGFNRLNLECDSGNLREIALLCCGLPKIAHMMGLHIAESTGPSQLRPKQIDNRHIARGIISAIREMTPEFQPDYVQAVRSNSKSQRLHKHILDIISCSPAEEVDNAFLSSELTKKLKKEVLVKHFATAVSQLKSQKRGCILHDGSTRGTHRFTSRLMKSYVFLHYKIAE